MPAGYLFSGGVDVNSIFMARSSAKIADLFISMAGVDISNHYEGRGGTTAVANTGIQYAGVDLAQYFRGSGSTIVTLSAMTCRANVPSANAVAVYSLNASGDINGTVFSNTVQDRGDWINPKSGMSNYAALATQLTGTAISGPLGVWTTIGGTTFWSLTRATLGTFTATFSVQIRRISDSVVVAGPVTISLEATRENPA